MNRAYLIILVPGLLVAVAYLAVGWGWKVALPVGLVAAVAVGAAVVMAKATGKRGEGKNG